MFCSNCGNQIANNVRFCTFCGAPQNVNYDDVLKQDEHLKQDGQVHKCPYCGEILPYDAIKCPSCGYELRGKDKNETVSQFMERLSMENDNQRKVEIINLYPVPNTREDILEFMNIAVSNLESTIRANDDDDDSEALEAAWISKINYCYRKGQILFKDTKDIDTLNELYEVVNGNNGVLKSAKRAQTVEAILKSKSSKIIIGIVLIMLSMWLMNVIGSTSLSALIVIPQIFLITGIVLFILGVKKEKTEKNQNSDTIDINKNSNGTSHWNTAPKNTTHHYSVHTNTMDTSSAHPHYYTDKQTDYAVSKNDKGMKDKNVALILCVFLGYFGAHKFYEGKVGMGILYLFTMGLCLIGVLVDIILLASKPRYYYV